jgi:hypothetical protein
MAMSRADQLHEGRAGGAVPTPCDLASLDRRRALWIGAALVVPAVAFLVARARWSIPMGRGLVDIEISNLGLATQLGALIAGAILVNISREPFARWWLVASGAACLLAHGAIGVAFLAALLLWWVVLAWRALGKLRFLLAALLLVALDACAWGPRALSSTAHLFSLTFTLRLLVHAYDRWQTDEPTSLRDFLVFVLPAPLLIVPPYMSVIPLFGGFATRFRPGLTSARLRTISRHILLAIATGVALAVVERDLLPAVAQPAAMYVRFLANVLGLATVAHATLALLLLHGVEERHPIDRPFLATRFVELWQRMAIHLKDAQVFLFYTPALLSLRRRNRYLAIVVATVWTLLVGNTLLHIVVRYCFVPDTLPRIGWALVANAVMTAALAFDLCRDEWRTRRGLPPTQTLLQRCLGWLITMTLASIVSWL